MDSVALFLLVIAAIMLIGTIGEIVFRRTRVPDVVWLVSVGILLGPVFGIVTRAQLASIAPYFGALTLVVVLFDGGSRLNLREVSRSAPRSGLLALLSFGTAAALAAGLSMAAAAVGWFPEGWTTQHALLFGAILGGSSSIVIMPAMTLGGVRESVANLLGLESAFTDVFCVVGATALIGVITGGEGVVSPGEALARSFGLGAAIGLMAGLLWLLVLRLLSTDEHAYPITLSALLVLYVMVDRAGGSAALGILAFAIVVGNSPLLGGALRIEGLDLGDDIRGFHRQVTFLIKSFFFTFMGAMLGPPWPLVALGVLIGVLLLVARVPAVAVAMLGSGLERSDRLLVTVAIPRGLAAGVLASMPTAAGIPGTENLPIIVFAAVFATILVFAVGFPISRRAAVPLEAPAEGSPSDDGAPSGENAPPDAA